MVLFYMHTDPGGILFNSPGRIDISWAAVCNHSPNMITSHAVETHNKFSRDSSDSISFRLLSLSLSPSQRREYCYLGVTYLPSVYSEKKRYIKKTPRRLHSKNMSPPSYVHGYAVNRSVTNPSIILKLAHTPMLKM